VTRFQSSLLAGAVAFVASVLIGLLAGYIKCLGEGVDYNFTIAVRIAAKMGAYAGIVIALLTFLTGTAAKK
jgi:hypothetical protein